VRRAAEVVAVISACAFLCSAESIVDLVMKSVGL
jgi:hypothetical protein